jgi:hypothetical protein
MTLTTSITSKRTGIVVASPSRLWGMMSVKWFHDDAPSRSDDTTAHLSGLTHVDANCTPTMVRVYPARGLSENGLN